MLMAGEKNTAKTGLVHLILLNEVVANLLHMILGVKLYLLCIYYYNIMQSQIVKYFLWCVATSCFISISVTFLQVLIAHSCKNAGNTLKNGLFCSDQY